MDPTPLIRLREPADLVAAVPWLLGFHPRSSAVLLGLGGPTGSLVLTARIDLVEAADAEVLGAVRDHLGRAGADRVVLLCYPDHPGPAPGAGQDLTADVVEQPVTGGVEELLDGLRGALGRTGVEVVAELVVGRAAWRVREEHGWSPSRSLPSTTAGPPGARRLAAAAVGQGRVVLADRDAVAATVAAPTGDPIGGSGPHAGAGGNGGGGDEVVEDRPGLRACGAGGRRSRTADPWRTDFPRVWRRWVDGGRTLDDATAGRLSRALRTVAVRDRVIATDPDGSGAALLDLLAAIARRTPAPQGAPICSVIACIALMEGDGTLANVALERALSEEPDYSLALIVLEASGSVDPPTLRALWRDGTAARAQ